MVAWGGITAAIAGVNNYRGLLAARIILGLTEATIVPSLLLISSQWYTKSEQATRFACWIAGVGAGQIVGGLSSYGFLQIQGASLASWQIMFLVLGLVSAAAGVAIIFLLPDTPMGAWFLTVDEKISLLKHVSLNKTGIRNRHVQWSQIRELVKDPQVWLIMLIVMLVGYLNHRHVVEIC
jgi:MFS family permease